MEPRGRGRARGQSRGQTPQQPQRTRPGSSQASSKRRPPQQRPGSQEQPPPAPQPAPREPQRKDGPLPPPPMGAGAASYAQQMAGRGSRRGDEMGVHGRTEGGPDAGNGAEREARDAAGSRGGGGGGNGVRGRTPRAAERVTRPVAIATKKGTTGQPITVTTNYFKLLQGGRWVLQQYRVDYAPEVDDTRVKKRMMYNAINEDKDISGYIFDGTVLYTPAVVSPREYFVQDSNDQPIRISMRHIGELAWGDYHYLQVFNIIIRKCLAELQLQLVGRNYFEPSAGVEMRDHNLVLWPGYFTSIKQHESDILLCSELQFKVMRLDTMLDCLNECRTPNVKKEFQNKVLGAIVLTSYNNKTYRVDDVDWSATPCSTFKKKDGSEISYGKYYKEKYNIRIKNDKQPMLVSRSKPREIRAGMPELVYLVPELCQMTGLTDKQRENFHLMRALAEYTRIGPQDRMRRLQQFSRRLLTNKAAVTELNKWSLSIANQLVTFSARVLPPENICLGNERKCVSNKDADWTRDLRSASMFNAPKMENLAVIAPKKLCKNTDDFIKLMVRAADGMKWCLKNYTIFQINDDKIAYYLDKIEEITNGFNPSLIICVVFNNNSDKYSAIKKKCYVDKGIPSQVIVSRNLSSKGAMSIATKVAIQLNCKIGGSPWTVVLPLNNLMVVGYDVCRDTANRSLSFSGMVASLDKQITRYFSFAVEHKHEEELSDHFASFILIACNKFKQHNQGNYPERILIYRDGVGDGQIPYVKDHEVDVIKSKLQQEIYKERDLKLAFVIVSKRVNTRIIYKENNPPPGTVVDDVITLPERYDFYIVSQCVRQGTVAPTNYNVIDDTMGLPPDRMQILTYKLTHLYFNWSGTVRVPAPCQYAHKLAFLVAQNLHRPAHRRLETTLYYL